MKPKVTKDQFVVKIGPVDHGPRTKMVLFVLEVVSEEQMYQVMLSIQSLFRERDI